MRFCSKETDAHRSGYHITSYHGDCVTRDRLQSILRGIDCMVLVNNPREYMGGFTVFTKTTTAQCQADAALSLGY